MSFVLALFWLVVVTFIPTLEARASIPFAFFHSDVRSAVGLPLAIGVCLLANIIVGMLAFWVMSPILVLFRRWGWFERRIWPIFERTRYKLHPYVERHGEWGLALFIGVPLPGTGAYSGALGAFLLGVSRRRFMVANFLGVVVACIAVTVVCVLIERGVVADDSLAGRILIKRSVGLDE
jgi:uncharacterized membrane protein